MVELTLQALTRSFEAPLTIRSQTSNKTLQLSMQPSHQTSGQTSHVHKFKTTCFWCVVRRASKVTRISHKLGRTIECSTNACLLAKIHWPSLQIIRQGPVYRLQPRLDLRTQGLVTCKVPFHEQQRQTKAPLQGGQTCIITSSTGWGQQSKLRVQTPLRTIYLPQ